MSLSSARFNQPAPERARGALRLYSVWDDGVGHWSVSLQAGRLMVERRRGSTTV